jgi:hypothetical protein
VALKFAITDLAGTQIAVVTDYDQGLVTIPYNDSRTAEVTLHPESPAGLVLGEEDNGDGVALRLMLKAWYVAPPYDPLLIFWGPIITPTWTLRAGQKSLRIEAHDISIRLKNHYLSGADATNDLHRRRRSGDRQLGRAQAAARRGHELGRREHRRHPRPRHRRRHEHPPGRLCGHEAHDRLRRGDTTMHVESTAGFADSGTAPATRSRSARRSSPTPARPRPRSPA